jgi:hypothetical protein
MYVMHKWKTPRGMNKSHGDVCQFRLKCHQLSTKTEALEKASNEEVPRKSNTNKNKVCSRMQIAKSLW